MFRRISSITDMQNSTDAMKPESGTLVAPKVDRLRGLPPESLVELRSQWRELTQEIAASLDADPTGAAAQAMGGRWTALLAQLMGQPVDAQALTKHHQEWTPQMASFVDKPVWDYMTRVLAARI